MELLTDIATFATILGMVFCVFKVVQIVDEANGWR